GRTGRLRQGAGTGAGARGRAGPSRVFGATAQPTPRRPLLRRTCHRRESLARPVSSRIGEGLRPRPRLECRRLGVRAGAASEPGSPDGTESARHLIRAVGRPETSGGRVQDPGGTQSARPARGPAPLVCRTDPGAVALATGKKLAKSQNPVGGK